MEQGILGLQPWAVLMGVIILLMAFLWWSSNRKRTKLNTEYGDKILVLFWTWGGKMLPVFCDEIRGEIHPPEEYKGDPKNLRMIKAPKGHELDVYFVQTDFIFDTWWPFDKPKKDQIKVKCVALFVNIPMPIIWRNLQYWTREMLENMTASLIGTSRDEAASRALAAQDSDWWNDLNKIGMLIQKIPMLVWIGLGSLSVTVIMAVLVWQVMSKVQYIIYLNGG